MRFDEDHQPLHKIVFNFNENPITVDDFNTAIASSYWAALLQLSRLAGDENGTVANSHFRFSDVYFDFDIGSDLYAHSDKFPLLYLKEIIGVFHRLGYTYNMRECTFRYSTRDDPNHLFGYLRNGPQRSPARVAPPFGTYSEHTPGGLYRFSNYRAPLDFDIVTRMMVILMDIAWTQMVRLRMPSTAIPIRKPFNFEYSGVHLEINRMGADKLSLYELLDIAFGIVGFGRDFYLREMRFEVDTTGLRRHEGQLSKSRGSISVN